MVVVEQLEKEIQSAPPLLEPPKVPMVPEQGVIQPYRIRRRKRRIWPYVLHGIAILFIGGIGWLVGRAFPQEPPPIAVTVLMPTEDGDTTAATPTGVPTGAPGTPEPTQTAVEKTVVVIVTATPGPPEPTQTPVIETVIVVASATPGPPEPTQTPVIETVIVVATPTSVPPTPTPEPSLLFFDDFEDGPDPAWDVTSGEVLVVNGRLTTSGGATLMIGDSSWTDYSVKCENWSGHYRDYTRILLRVRGDDQYRFQYNNFGKSYWSIGQDGSWQKVPRSDAGGVGDSEVVVEVFAVGDLLRAYIDGNRVSSFVDGKFPNGRVGITVPPNALIDNFTVTEVAE